MDSKDWITIIGLALTFFIGLINWFATTRINKRTVFVNTVTSERVKWMGQLKELLSEYLSLTTFYEQKPIFEGEGLQKYLEKLIYLKNRIKLHLNYIDDRDKEIIDLIEKINTKIFGLYDISKIMELPKEKRYDALPNELKQKYIENAIEKLDAETMKKYLMSEDLSILTQVIKLAIESLNEDIKRDYGFSGRDELKRYCDQLVDKSRVYLKYEWERVKREADKGRFNK